MASEESISLFSIRNAQLSDLQILSHIVFQAFKTHNESVGLPIDLDFGSVDVAFSNVKEKLENPYSEGVVAVNECGRPIALGFIVFGRQVHSINLVAVDPESSRKGVGKAIMLSLLDKANKTAASSVRLTQGANCRSFALYSGLGFFPAEYFNQFVGTINCEQAKSAASSLGMSIDGLAVRPMKLEDVKACSELFKVVLGYDREVEIKQRLGSFPASLWVVTKSETIIVDVFIAKGIKLLQIKSTRVKLTAKLHLERVCQAFNGISKLQSGATQLDSIVVVMLLPSMTKLVWPCTCLHLMYKSSCWVNYIQGYFNGLFNLSWSSYGLGPLWYMENIKDHIATSCGVHVGYINTRVVTGTIQGSSTRIGPAYPLPLKPIYLTKEISIS